MDLELTPEQRELRTVAADFLARRVEPDVLWQELRELGWYEVGLEEDDPFGIPGLCLIAEQQGRNLAFTLLVDVAVIARVTPCDAPYALAVLEQGGSWDPEQLETTVTGDGRVDGVKLAVRHGAEAAGFGVIALRDGEPVLALVAAGAPGVEITSVEGVDAGAHVTRVRFDSAPAVTVVADADAIARALRVGAVATAAEAVGAAAQALDLAIAYAGEREQFGRPIGRFQAVQHLLSEAHVLRDTAWSSCLFAAAALDEDHEDATESAAVAKAYAARAAREVTELALQVFGGVGFTEEHDLHLHLRRVLDCEQRFGGAGHHEARLVTQLAGRLAEVAR
ncbi:MAG TPA: acyl-CoA dehydrogenase family protein [Solirubrobacteraceae bacterium]